MIWIPTFYLPPNHPIIWNRVGLAVTTQFLCYPIFKFGYLELLRNNKRLPKKISHSEIFVEGITLQFNYNRIRHCASS